MLTMPMIDAITPPNGMPQYMTLTAVLRALFDTASEDNAIRFGSAPPRPMPVSTRTSTSMLKLLTSAVAIDNKPKTHAERISTRLRPMRSARRPPNIAPGRRPNVPALNARPICATDKPNSRAMRGAATPTDCKSSPSSRAMAKQRLKVTTAALDLAMGCVVMPSPGTAVLVVFI